MRHMDLWKAAGVRWQALFDDLEGQLAAADSAEFAAEVAERTRREGALLRTQDRLLAAVGHVVTVTTGVGGTVGGQLMDVGPDWLLLDEPGHREALIPLAAVLAVSGLGRRSGVPGAEGEVGRRLDLRSALRGLARGRAAVSVVLRDGSLLLGTLDRVGADHLELAEHPPGEPRRAGAVRQVRLVPFSALVLLRSS